MPRFFCEKFVFPAVSFFRARSSTVEKRRLPFGWFRPFGFLFLFVAVASASASGETLILSHFLGSGSPTHVRFLEPWAREVEAASGGRMRVEIYPSMALGGKPAELYRQLRDGAADVVWTLTGYTPGVFPRTEVYELPTVHGGSAEHTTVAIQENFGWIAPDFAEVRPLLIHVHAGNALHLTGDCVEGPESLRGLKLRTPSRTGGWLIEALGAEPVGMPVPELPLALSRNAVDGALIPYQVLPSLQVHELTRCSLSLEKDGRFGTSVFMFAMNLDRYENLAPELRKVIDEASGIGVARKIGRLWDEMEIPGKQAQLKTGSGVIELDRRTSQAVRRLSEEAEKRWLEAVAGLNFDGRRLLRDAARAVASQSVD